MMDSDLEQADQDRFVLPIGYRLNEYRICRSLGCGGFGITYLARDERLDRDVAIKEFMPGDLALRHAGSTVVPRSPTARVGYGAGLKRFLEEARTLAKFSHRNIVDVLTFFEANGTAYIVMRYEEGEALGNLLAARRAPLSAAELIAIADPLLDGLAAVHRAGVLHRDIKPANIFIRGDGSPVLLDFGAARQVVGHASRSLVSILTPGYAPFEQYNVRGDQGTWTDVHGIGAVLYSCISGRVPPEAPARAQAQLDRQPDPLTPAVVLGKGRYPDRLLQAIDQALAVLPRDRLQSVEQLRLALRAGQPSPVVPTSGRLAGHWLPITAGGSAVLLAGAAALLLFEKAGPPMPQQPNQPAAPVLATPRTPAFPSTPPTAQPAPPVVVPALPPRELPPPAPEIRPVVMPPTAPTTPSATTGPKIDPAMLALQDDVTLGTARDAVRVSVDYGRQTFRRKRQMADAVPSLERLATLDTRYQMQLDAVRRNVDLLDQEAEALLRQYAGLVDQLAQQPERFRRIRERLLALDVSEAANLGRRRLMEHVEARSRGPSGAEEWRPGLDRSYASADLW